jgi:hypothetical protein
LTPADVPVDALDPSGMSGSEREPSLSISRPGLMIERSAQPRAERGDDDHDDDHDHNHDRD